MDTDQGSRSISKDNPVSHEAAETKRLTAALEASHQAQRELSNIIHDMTVGNQAAWIEWKHGQGADAAMMWIHNGLVGPGHLPDDEEPWGKEAQAYFDANCANPLPPCACGRPSNILWMGQGFCSDDHYRKAKASADSVTSNGNPRVLA